MNKTNKINYSSKYISGIMLFTLGLSFAFILVLNRIAAENNIPFIPYVFWQSIGGCFILFVIALFSGGLPPMSWAHIRIYFVSGFLNLAIPYLIFAYVASKVPSGILSLGLSLIPVTTYALALFVKLDKFKIVKFFGILLGLAGVISVLLPSTSLPSQDMVGWVILGLMAPFCYALNTICVALLRPPDATSVQLAGGLMLVGAICMIFVMLLTSEWWAFNSSFNDGYLATIIAMFNNALAFYLIFELIKRTGPVYFSMVNYLATIVGIIIGISFFADSLSLWIWIALILIGLSLVLVNFSSTNKVSS
ncbi:DMT family transporter [Alphaproteobacteria bacterium]|nr:DMT family transporter [Alphaproteobacteria bacterium]